ncbi:MAG: PIN domain-containing protein [Desulfosporosinus sp.]
MVIIDANVILRYIFNDNEDMATKAKDIIVEGAMTTVEVVAEVVYVLLKVYKVTREDINNFIVSVLNEVYIDKKPVVLYAFEVFKITSMDFVDCLLIAYRKVLGIDIFTFDAKIIKYLDHSI